MLIAISIVLMLAGLAGLVVLPALGALFVIVSALVFLLAGNRRRADAGENEQTTYGEV